MQISRRIRNCDWLINSQCSLEAPATGKVFIFHEAYLILSGAKLSANFLKVQSALPRYGSLL